MKKLAVLLFLALTLATASAFADTLVYTFTVNGCSGSGGCGPGPYGTVTLTTVDSDTVNVLVTLQPGEIFAKTGAGDALEFNITGNPTISLSNITTGFAAGPAPDTASTFGSFMYSVSCTTGCGNGTSDPQNPGPLSFDVTVAGGLTVNDFIANGDEFFFTTDIFGNGNTGNVAAQGTPTVVPEPTSMALLGTGLFGMAGAIRRRLRK